MSNRRPRGDDGVNPTAPGATPTLRDRANVGVAWSALHIWATGGIQLGLILVLARLLSPRDFGLFAMAQVVLVLVHALARQGVPEALVQTNRDAPKVWSTGLVGVLAGSVVAAAVLGVAAPLFGSLFDAPLVTDLLRWLAPGVIIYGLHAVLHAWVRTQLDFATVARAGVAGGVAEFVVAVPLAAAGYGVWVLVVGFYATAVMETLVLFRASRGVPLVGFDAGEYRRLARFGRYVVGTSFATFLNRRTDDFFVGLFLGPEILGYYTVAYRLLEFVTTVFLRAVRQVTFPVFSKLQRAPHLVADAIRTSFRFTSLVAFPAFAGLAVIAHDAVTVVLGAQWLPAVDTLRILAWSGLALCATNVLPGALRAAGHPQWETVISGVKGILLAAAFAVAAGFGLEAVAWVFTVGVYMAFPVYYLAARQLFPVPIGAYLAEAAGPAVATGAMVAGVLIAQSLWATLQPIGRLGMAVTFGVAIYLLVTAVVAGKTLRELYHRLHGLRGGGSE